MFTVRLSPFGKENLDMKIEDHIFYYMVHIVGILYSMDMNVKTFQVSRIIMNYFYSPKQE